MVLVLRETDVNNVINMKAAVACLESAFREQSEGRVLLPERQVIQPNNSDAIVRIMAASATNLNALGLKALLGKPATRKPESTYFVILLFDPKDSSLLAVISASRLTQLRTGAASGVATKYLARSNSETIGLIGAGIQGFGQLEGVAAVTKLREGFVFDLYEASARALIEKAQSKLGVKLQRTTNLDEIYKADIICTATTAVKPIVFGDKLRPGMHINAVGSNAPNRQEIHESVLSKSKVYVDQKEQVLIESGDLVIPSKQGSYDISRIRGNICDVVTGKIEGRKSSEEITLFKSVGIALEDIAVARLAYELGQTKGLGQEISLQ
jgi:alanine dehydrogenase